MNSIPSLTRKLIRVLQVTALVASALILLFVVVLLIAESRWNRPVEKPDEHSAFLYASTGTELMPKVVFDVLPDMFPDHFQPAGPAAGDWITQFGFIRGRPGINEGLPLGFSISYQRPKSGAPSPVACVGFSCGLCHVSPLTKPDGNTVMVEGMGNASLDFIAWVDGVRSSILDKRMTPAAIGEACERKFHRKLTAGEKIMVRAWLPGSRRFFENNLPKYDAPFSGRDLRDANLLPNGPARTQPFRNLIRIVLDRPATSGDHAYCKVPSLYEQKNRHWGQYDGSVGNRLSRSVLAAIATGATTDNLLEPHIESGVLQAVNYTVNLHGPRYAAFFPDRAAAVNSQQAARGRAVYMRYCVDCHGIRDEQTGAWTMGRLTGEVVPAQTIGTDAERLSFRYYDELPDAIFAFFPKGHPLRPKREDLRPGPKGRVRGYMNAPIESVFARAPFLHNGSILTLAELINLKPRRDVFYRGANVYDPDDLGLASPPSPTTTVYWRYDTHARGNSNAGHDYPWPYRGTGWNEPDLMDLLAFLKTQY